MYMTGTNLSIKSHTWSDIILLPTYYQRITHVLPPTQKMKFLIKSKKPALITIDENSLLQSPITIVVVAVAQPPTPIDTILENERDSDMEVDRISIAIYHTPAATSSERAKPAHEDWSSCKVACVGLAALLFPLAFICFNFYLGGHL